MFFALVALGVLCSAWLRQQVKWQQMVKQQMHQVRLGE
jgi:hypothetical protein